MPFGYRGPEKASSLDRIAEDSPTNAPSYDAEKAGEDPLSLEARLVEGEKYGQTQRGLKSRHVQLIAIGGAIGN